tara:strand:- start:2962 stop:3153 length:192 start_codon:yes stop_codon:yes gene_type:complete
MKYAIFTKPVQFTKDYKHACIIADEYFNKTGIIVAVEEVQRLHQFPSQNADLYKTPYFTEFAS